jgi:signal transduction histidine kinase/CheY-like chemotaxis protein
LPVWRLITKPKPFVIWFGVLLIVLICIGAALAAYELRLRDISEAKRELRGLDILLVEETERSVQSVDLVLRSLQEKVAADGIVTPEAFSRNLVGREMSEMLKARVTGIPQLDDVAFVSTDGRLINMSRDFPAPDVNLSDREYFLALKDQPADFAFLSAPLHSRTIGRLSLYLARRVSGPSGEFVGVVVARLDLAYFQNLFKALQGGKGDGVSLWRRDGTLIVYSPTLTDPTTLFKPVPGRKLRRAGEPFTYEVAASANSPARIVAAMAGREFPLVLSVSRTLDEILADWYQFLALLSAGTLFCILTIATVVWLLVRQFSTYEQLTAAVEERSRAVAQREHAEAQLRQAQKLESIGQLTGGVAHDFNNLLTAVLGNLDLLTRRLEGKDERLYNFAKNAFDAANRGASLTQRLLAFSRRQPLDSRPTEIGGVLGSIGEILRRTLGENIELAVVFAPEVWPVMVDENQLQSAILNIAINARDAMDGRGRLQIAAANCLKADQANRKALENAPGDYVLLSIKDGGKGMDDEVLQRVFEPFFSTKPAGRGTGLGLSQVYGFIKQTGGHIDIHSEVGKGTTVSMYLPRAESEGAVAAPVLIPEAEQNERGTGRILLVEDDADVRAYSAEILRELGYIVRDVANPKTALEMLREDARISLIFTDMGLPGMNGRELVNEARRIRPEIRVLYMTGYAEDSINELGVTDIDVNIIAKPFTRQELVKKINMVLAPPEDCPGA